MTKGDIMDYIKGLNEQQKEAVLTKAKHVRIIAGAGSGKTRVLTTRLVHLVQALSYDPSKLCAITFTNKAANEMKDRLQSMLGDNSYVHVSTIHSLCVRIIRMEYEALDLPRSFVVLDTSDQNGVMKEAYDRFDYQRQDLPYRDVLAYISGNKMAHISPKEAWQMCGDMTEEVRKARIYEFYVERLKEMGALDFDDLLLEVYYLLKTNKKARERWQKRFDVICVDEFQDVDQVQYGIVQSLVGLDNELYVVGDPDQTIYSWRGANVNYISEFNKVYPDAVTITLMMNYRSTQEILSYANDLIRHNKNRPHKDLIAHSEEHEPLEYHSFDDGEEEANWIARKMIDMQSRGVSYNDQAILYRSNYLSRQLEKSFTRYQVPYIIYGGQSFYDQMEIRDMLAYLRMISHGDDLALRRTVAKPRRGIGEKTLATLALRAEEKGSTIYQIMLFDTLNNQAKPNIKKYVNQIEKFKKEALELSLDKLMHKVFEESGLKDYYEHKGEVERIDSVYELYNDAVGFVRDQVGVDLVDYLQMISLYTDKEQTEDTPVVRMMTVHAAKGLEFENVFIVGLSDGVFPNQRSIQESGLEEERRLMYVALTRAKKRLFLSNNSGYSFVTQGRARASRFIREMKVEEVQTVTSGIRVEEPHEVVGQAVRVEQARKNRREIDSADIVVHEIFGEGIVIKLEGDMATIAFNYPHGTKKLSLAHTEIKRKESDE